MGFEILDKVFGSIFKGVEAIAESAIGKALEFLVQIIYSWLAGMLETIGSWWLEIDPVGASENVGVVNAISDTTRPLAAMLGTIGLIIGFVRVGRSQGAREDTSLLIEGLMRVAIAGGAAIPGTQLLMSFSSAFSPWVYKTILGIAKQESTSLMDILPQNVDNAVVGLVGLSFIFIGPLMLFASIIQAMMAMGTDIAASLLSGLLPITAATSVTAQGNKAFWKQVGWIIACVAFKPAAAIVYGFGVALAIGGNLTTVNGTSNPALSMIAGVMVIILACFSLPSLVSLVAPMPSVVGSSGGRFVSAAAGAAVGAVVVAAVGAVTAGTGSAAAAGAGGASSAGGTAAGSSAAGGATSTAGSAGATTAGGASGSSAAGASSTASEATATTGAGAESSGNAGSTPATGSSQSTSEGNESATETGNPVTDSGESSTSGELGAEDVSASGGTPGTASEGTPSNTAKDNSGAEETDAAGTDSSIGGGDSPRDDSLLSHQPESRGTTSASGDNGVDTPHNNGAGNPSEAETGTSDTTSNGTDTGAKTASASGSTEASTTSGTSTGGTSQSASTGSGAVSTESSGASSSSESTGSGASTSTSSDSGAASTPARSDSTTTNSSYRPRGGSAAHDAARYLQDMIRVAGDETEGAIRPEGAGQ